MKLLLDTHTLIWWKNREAQLSARAVQAMSDPESDIYVSAATTWEIATKFRLGKLPAAKSLIENFVAEVFASKFFPLDITVEQARVAGLLEAAHSDPFDRMLAAQALDRDLVIVSKDQAFDSFGVSRLW